MRPLELLLIAALFVAAVISLFYLRKPWPAWLLRGMLLSVGALAVSQILWEGWRWQMLPAYIGILPLIFLPASRSFVSHALIAIPIASGLLSAGLGYTFPVFRLPTPRGPYRVGTFTRHLIDHNRHERHASSPDAPRELMVQVWYPAKDGAGSRAWYRDPRMNTAKSSYFRLVKTHSYWNLPVADEPRVFPVLLFSPSSGGFRNQNTFEVEELVSQGYIVVGIDHPYSSSRVVFPDGRIAHSVPWIETASQAAFDASNRRVERMVEDHVADARFLLNEMERWNQPGSKELLSGRMELTRVGVFGHSFGGALAGGLCVADSRVVAGINMDGWMFGDAEKNGIRKPFFFMSSGDGRGPERAELDKLSGDARIEGEKDLLDWQATLRSLREFGGYHLTILGSDHGNYSDLILFKRELPFIGPPRLDPYQVFETVNAYTLAFFDRYVRLRPAPLLDRPGAPGVRLEVYAPPKQEPVGSRAASRL